MDCKRTSTRLHRLVTLVRSSSIEILDYAFWLLQEEAGHEAAAVLSILSFFHDRLYLSRIAWSFYVRTIESLSQAREGASFGSDSENRLPGQGMRSGVWRCQPMYQVPGSTSVMSMTKSPISGEAKAAGSK